LTYGSSPKVVSVGDRQQQSLSDFATIHMRKDPPYDLRYVETTWMLDLAGKATLVVNSPSILRDFNEKLGILQFPEHCVASLVSADPELILKHVARFPGGEAIVKPLDLFGGRDIIRIRHSQQADARKLLEEATGNGMSLRMVQPFLPDIFEGEVRVFTVGGEPISWCLKKPARGEFLANTRMGATLHPYVPSSKIVQRVKEVAVHLNARGAPFLGMDIIGEWITEINLTSPRVLLADMADLGPFDKMADWLLEALTRK
jgi:glutathione synthase